MTTTTPARRHSPRDYARAPLNIYWEVTRACALACRHCRAEAMPTPDPRQLSPAAGLAFLRQITGFGEPLPQLVITGGDPLARPDLPELVDEAAALGIPLAITPSATPRLTQAALGDLRRRGVESLGLSLDSATPRQHDAIRGVPGTFARTIAAAHWAGELGMPLQINTLVADETVDGLPAIYELLCALGVARWSLFFLIGVGRGRVLQPLSPAHVARLMHWIYDCARAAPFVVTTTEAPFFRRVALERMRAEGAPADEIRRSPLLRSFGVRDGHGIVFVSSTGDICPAGFLPLVVGNVQADSIVEVYRAAPVFRDLHAPERFGGTCGRCPYRALCGGSRARAFAATGDPLAADPLCLYQPEHDPQPLEL